MFNRFFISHGHDINLGCKRVNICSTGPEPDGDVIHGQGFVRDDPSSGGDASRVAAHVEEKPTDKLIPSGSSSGACSPTETCCHSWPDSARAPPTE